VKGYLEELVPQGGGAAAQGVVLHLQCAPCHRHPRHHPRRTTPRPLPRPPRVLCPNSISPSLAAVPMAPGPSSPSSPPPPSAPPPPPPSSAPPVYPAPRCTALGGAVPPPSPLDALLAHGAVPAVHCRLVAQPGLARPLALHLPSAGAPHRHGKKIGVSTESTGVHNSASISTWHSGLGRSV